MKKLSIALTVIVVGLAGLFVLSNVTAQIGNYKNGRQMMDISTSGTACHIAGATTTSCKGTAGTLYRVVIGTGAALAKVTIYDVAAPDCLDSPQAGLTSAVILPLAIGNPVTLEYSADMTNGICVVTSALTDVTVIYQ